MAVGKRGQRQVGGQNRGSLRSCLIEVFITFLIAVVLIFLAAAGPLSSDKGNSGPCQVSDAFPPNVTRWCGWITDYAAQSGLPPDLVAALIWQESGGNPEVISSSGAVGLMQVMPRDGLAANFLCQGELCFQSRPASMELLDPRFNIEYGTHLLAEYVQSCDGDLRQALKIYGPLDVGFQYADKILSLYQQYGKP